MTNIHITNPAGQGPAGIQGAMGPQGPKGDAGAQGEQGPYVVQGGTSGTQPTFNGAPLFYGHYQVLDGITHYDLQVLFTNITGFGSGQYHVSLPTAAAAPYHFRDGVLTKGSNGKHYAISGSVAAGSNLMYLFYTASNGLDDEFTQSSPVVLSQADNFHIAGTYRHVTA